MKQSNKTANEKKPSKIIQETNTIQAQKNCNICGFKLEKNIKSNEQGFPVDYLFEGLYLMQCKICGIFCHSYCYGLSIQSNLIGQHSQGQIIEIECDGCKEKGKKVCMLCLKTGMLKKLSDHPDKFVHVPCALFSQQIEVMSYMSMNFATRIDAKRSKVHKCSCCGKNDATLVCSADKCSNIIHPSCLISELNEGKQVWSLNLHFPMDNIQQTENKNDITEDIFNGELHQVLQIFIGALENSREPEEIQKQVKQNTESLFVQIKKDFSISQNDTNQNSQTLQQAAQIQVYCPKHNSENSFYCVCATQQILPAMVQCTECCQYYHPQCIQKRARDVNRNTFICEPCKEWFQKREKIGKLIIEPRLVDLGVISFPQKLNKVGFMDLVPIFIFLEQLCARFSCGLGELLAKREFSILKKYREFLNLSPLCPSQLIQLQKLQVKELITDSILSKKSQFYQVLGSLKSEYFFAIQQKFHGGGYNIDFIDELLSISKETALMQQVGTVQMKLKQVKKIILEAQLTPNVIEQLRQHAKSHNQPDLRTFIIEARPYKVNSLLHVLEKYFQLEVLKQNTRELLTSINNDMELENEIDQYNDDNDGDKMIFERKQNELFFENLKTYQSTKPCKQTIEEILLQFEKTMIESRFQSELKDLLQEVKNIEESSLNEKSFQKIVELPVTSPKLQTNFQIYYEHSVVLLLQNQLLQLLERKVTLTVQQKLKLFNEDDLNKVFQLPLLPSLIKYEQDQFQIAKNIIQQSNQTEINDQEVENIEGIILNLNITSPQIEQFKSEVVEKTRNLRNLVFGMYQLWYPDHKVQFQNALDFVILQEFPQQPLQQLLQSTEKLKLLEKNVDILKDYNQPKVQQLIKKFQLLLWRCQSDLIVHEANSEKPRIPKSLLRQLIEQQSEHQSLEHRDISAFRELKRLFSELQSWLEQYRSLGKNDLVQTLECISVKKNQEGTLTQKQINSQSNLFQRQTMELLKKAVKSPIDLSVEINALIALQLQLIWIWKAQTLLDKNTTYQTLQVLQLYAKELQLPESYSLVKQIESRLILFVQVKNQLKEYSQQRIEWQQDRERQIQNLKNVRQQLIYITRKPSYDHVKRIAQLVKELNYISNETEFIQVDIENAEHMASRFSEVMQESENIQQLKEIRRMMLYSFLKVDGIASQVSYFILKSSVKRLLQNGHPTLNVLQQKLDDIKALCQLDKFIQSKIQLPFENSEPIIIEYSNQLKNFLQTETFDWVIQTESNLRVDLLALSLQQRLKKGWEIVQSSENEQMNDNERFSLRQQHFVKFQEVDDFTRNSMKNVRYLQKSDLQSLKAQYEGSLYLKKSFEEMVERLREFQLRLDIEAVETLIDEYLDGGVHLFIDEMFTLLQYLNMARTFWSEINEHKEIMRQPVLDARKNQSIHEKLNGFSLGWKKLNFEIPDVRRFFEEYSKVNSKLEEISNTVQQKNTNELIQIKQYLNKDVPQHLRCLDIYAQCCVLLWQAQVNEMLTEQIVWNYSRLVQEINEAYRLLEILIGKSLPQLTNPLEEFQMSQLMEKIFLPLQQLELLYHEIEELNPDTKTLFKGKIDLNDRSSSHASIKPFENLLSYAEKIRQKNLAKNKQQGSQKKKIFVSLRVKPKGHVKSIIKVGKKTIEQQNQQHEQITDNNRSEKRITLVNLLKKHQVFPNPERLGKQLENEIHTESQGKKEVYERTFENFKTFFASCSKQIAKKLAQKEFDYTRFSKYIQQNNPSTPAAPKLVHVQSLKNETESSKKKPRDLTNKTPIKQQSQVVEQIIYSIKKQISESEKITRQQSGEEPIKKIKTESNAIFYNPDKETVPLQARSSDVLSLGTLSLKIASKNIIKPIFLSQDPYLMTTLIPGGFNDFCIHFKAQCPAQQVIEYLLSHKDQIKCIRGWILGKDLKESEEIFNLAQTLRQQKNSMGARFYENLLGVTIMPIEYLTEKLQNFNYKWVLQKPVDQNLLDQINSYQSLEILKPSLGFVLYIKDIVAYKGYLEKNNKIKSQQIQDFIYDPVYKVPKLNQLIETQKEIHKQQKFDERKTDLFIQKEYEAVYPIIPKTPGYYEIQQSRNAYEPISDDEMNGTYNYQNEDTGLHNMILNQVPNILSLLKEEK